MLDIPLYKPFDSVLLRAPLNSINGVNNCFYSSLRDLYSSASPSFLEGLYLSAPEYFDQVESAMNDAGNSNKNIAKLHQTWCKYWVRSSMRCTPYGTFAGCRLITLNNETKVQLSDNMRHIRRVRLDMNYLTDLINAISRLKIVRQQLLFFCNSSLYNANDTFRFVEYSIKQGRRHYVLNSVDYTQVLSEVFKVAKNGVVIQDLVAMLTKDDIPQQEAESFVNELIASQILISEIEPNITGEEPLKVLINKLEKLKGVDKLVCDLRTVHELICHPESAVNYYRGIEQCLRDLQLEVGIPRNVFQTDMFLSLENNTIASSSIEEIVKNVSQLAIISRKNKNPDLDNFKTKFLEKYEQQQVPLLTALDAEIGIGYGLVDDSSTGGNEMTDGLANYGNGQNVIEYDFINEFVYTKYHDFLLGENEEIEITDADLESLYKKVGFIDSPDSKFILGNLLMSEDGVSRFNLRTYAGPSAANLLARFAHGDEKIRDFVIKILDHEEQCEPDAIFAEIVHLPESRTGNVLLRPLLRKYEIPYIGNSGAPIEAQIDLNDLVVSVVNSKIVLKSKSHKKIIYPRLSTAHNFQFNSLPVYKFLCDLQYYDRNTAIDWHWGFIENSLFLPRVTYKNIILKPARWTLSEDDLIGLPNDRADYEMFFHDLCIARKLPYKFLYIDGDSELLIDLRVDGSIQLLVEYIRKNGKVIVKEYFFDTNNCVVKAGDMQYANELIIPVYKEKKQKILEVIQDQEIADIESLKRKFAPGSEWLYLKIYCSSKRTEKILKEIILPFIMKNKNENLFEKFFFIRYYDPQPHLRLRFLNKDVEKNEMIFRSIVAHLSPMIDNGTIDKIMLDTYIREIERYGPRYIELSESLFFHDSEAVLKFIDLLEGQEGEYYRWVFAMRSIDSLLSDFNFNLKRKSELLKLLQKSFFNEFGSKPETQRYLNDKYRQKQKGIFTLLNASNDHENDVVDAADIFKRRSALNMPVAMQLIQLSQLSTEIWDIENLLFSFIHMSMNRLFISQNRKHELVIYHFLDKYYSSQLAIQNGRN